MLDNAEHHATANHEAQLRSLISAGKRGEAVKYFMRDMVGVPSVFVFLMRLMPGTWRQLTAVAHTLPYDAAVMGEWSLPTARFASIQVPVVAMHGGKTDPRLQKAARALAGAVPHARHRVLERQSHNVKPEVLSRALVEIFAENH
jgi:pimeloyl-ACP methyl ester carboxylesterase